MGLSKMKLQRADLHRKLKKIFPCSLRDFLILLGILVCATELCAVLRMADGNDGFVSMIYVLAVLLISRLTNGYLYGLIASFVGVFGVNYIFTYPYLAFNFTIAGYPLTFLTMLIVSIITCALTTQIKQQERVRAEGEKEKLRANLLRSVSHDIRTPLTSIVGSTSAVLDNEQTLSEQQKRSLLEGVRSDAQWLIRVVENLLSITRFGNDASELDKTEEAAEEVLAEAVRKFRKLYPEIKVTVQAPEELLLVPMDAILVEQVLSNLLENAVLHGKTVTIIRLSVRREGDDACFSVEDNGCGIPKAKLPVLFEGTLQRIDNQKGDGKRNMGIGLTVCMAIVKAHGGTMHAENSKTGGAIFEFRLPMGEEHT